MKDMLEKTIYSRAWVSRVVLVLFGVSLVPLLIIAAYNHPCADDFSFGIYTVHMWRDTGSLWQTMVAAVEGTKNVYATWQGSFVAVFLMMLQPAVFSADLYPLASMAVLLGFVAALFFMLKVILINYFGTDKHSYQIIAAVTTFLSMQFVLSPVEGFYWINGAMYYTGFHSLAMVLFALVLLSGKTERTTATIGYGVGVVVLGFAIGGANFVTALTTGVILMSFAIYRVWKRGKWGVPVLAFAALAVALAISAIAPGNAIRQEHFHQMNPILAILQSFRYAILFGIGFGRLSVLIGVLCLTPLIYRIAKGTGYSFRLPGVVTVFLYGVFATTFTPNLYSWSSFGPARAVNISYYQSVLFLLLLLFYWCGWVGKKILPKPVKIRKGKVVAEDHSFSRGLTGLLVLCFVLGCLIVIGNNVNSMSSVSATRSLFTGEAGVYRRENQARLAAYNSGESVIQVPAFTYRPYVLFFDDITSDPTDWRNIAVASFYGKESVQLVD